MGVEDVQQSHAPFRSASRRTTAATEEHWQHLRTTNPIESTFATVRLRHRKTKGSGSRVACLAMVFKLAQAAEKKWPRLNGAILLRDVIDGIQFKDGIRAEDAA